MADPCPRAPSGAHCHVCGATTADDQRYCLACGALVGNRRLDPSAFLARHVPGATDAVPPSVVPTAVSGPRPMPLAATTAAILIAGVSGMLVTDAGSDTGARAAIVAPSFVAPDEQAEVIDEPAATDVPPELVPAPDVPSPEDDTADGGDSAVAGTTPVAKPEPEPNDADDDDNGSADSPRVWLLALEGPRAAEAVDRIAAQGVRLTGMRSFTSDARTNAAALLTGTNPAGPADAMGTKVGALPAALLADDRKWRAYVDAQPAGSRVLPGACDEPPAGDATAAALALRLPFGRLAASPKDLSCADAVTGLEALGNDLSAGDDVPALSYVALGGCAPPERSVIALPDAVEDAVATITTSTEFQNDGLLIVTTVGTVDACVPPVAAPADPAAGVGPGGVVEPVTPVDSTAAIGPAATPVAPATINPTTAPVTEPPRAPTVVVRPTATAGRKLAAELDPPALTRSMADVLGVAAPGNAGADAVPRIKLPGVTTTIDR